MRGVWGKARGLQVRHCMQEGGGVIVELAVPRDYRPAAGGRARLGLLGDPANGTDRADAGVQCL